MYRAGCASLSNREAGFPGVRCELGSHADELADSRCRRDRQLAVQTMRLQPVGVDALCRSAAVISAGFARAVPARRDWFCLGPARACVRSQYAAQLRARSAVDGRDFGTLQRLEADLAEAAASQHYERAVRLRNTLERLQYLCDQLAILRAPPLPDEFVYPLELSDRPVWYLIASSRVVAAAPVPTTSDDAHDCARLFAQMLKRSQRAPTDADRPVAQIVSSWFRTHPAELRGMISAADAFEFCRTATLRRA